jgi:hypothetical protein
VPVGWIWVADLILLVLVIPVILLFLNRVLRPALEIKKYADDVLVHGVLLTGTMDAIPKLVDTLNLTTAAKGLVGRYGAALERIL